MTEIDNTKTARTTTIPGQVDLIEEMIARFPEKGRLLDIGTGAGHAARRFAKAGWEVTASGFEMAAYLGEVGPLPDEVRVLADLDICDMAALDDGSFDAVWCAHVLEHVSDTGRALAEIRRVLKPGGWLFIAVPPFKPQVVGGHVNTGWNIGTLMYVLADAGFGLEDGAFVRHGYNVFGMVQRGPGRLEDGNLRRANGDIETLVRAGRFPKGRRWQQGFDGRMPMVNWTWQTTPSDLPVPRGRIADPGPVARMRIGFFIPWITQGKGGTENVGQMMANAMAGRGHEVVIFTFNNKPAPSRWPLHESIELVQLAEADDEVSDRLMVVEVASRGLDLIVGLHMNRTFARYVRCGQKLGLPVVVSEHIDPRFPNWNGVFGADERVVAFSGATLIHMLIDAFRPTLPGFLQSRIRVIPNTIREPEILAEPGAQKPRKTLLTVARMVPRKNLARLIDAFATLASDFPDWTLRIVGDGPEGANLRAQVEALNISEVVDFAGHQEDPYPFYAEADAFVIPSAFEGFPMTLNEALAHGVPAVGYEICDGVAAQIIPGENGFLAKGGHEVGTLADDLRRLMEDADLRARMGAAARLSFTERFGNAVIFSAWEEMFAEAIQRGPVVCEPSPESIAAVRLKEMVWGPIKITPPSIEKA